MKFTSALFLSLIVSPAAAFAPATHNYLIKSSSTTSASSSLSMTTRNENNNVSDQHVVLSRRSALIATGILAASSSIFPSAALALGGSSEPKFENMKQIYSLGVSLDSLKAKVADPDQSEAALVGLRSFNRDPNFYTGYARNFISKTVKNNADGDVRVGYIRQASSVIGSIQELLEGRQGLYGADASKEAVARVEKAQALIGRFLAECGIEDERFGSFVLAHPY